MAFSSIIKKKHSFQMNVTEDCCINEEVKCENHPLGTQEEIYCLSIEIFKSEEDDVSD